MKVPSSYHGGRSSLEIQMTPMIDVVFLLLVFFVWTAGFQIAEYILPSNVSAAAGNAVNPSEAPPPEADFDNIIVRVQGNNDQPQWLVNGQSMASLNQVGEMLARIAKIKPDAPVILHPDPGIPLGTVIDAYDTARAASLKKVQFATSGAPAP